MARCIGCGEPYRKGKRVIIHFPNGEHHERVVCVARCVKRASKIVSIQRGTLCKCCPSDDTNEASVCNRCSNDQLHKAVAKALEPYVKHLQKLALAYRKNDDPKHEGLTMAANILHRQGVPS